MAPTCHKVGGMHTVQDAVQFVEASNTDWQRFVDGLPGEMPQGASVADTTAIMEAVKGALRTQGYNIL